MIIKLLLDAKREGNELSSSDIRDLISLYTKGDVPDYQMAAFAMAVCCKGMSPAEIFALTDAMRLSGSCLDWSEPGMPPTADKHSTGGVGDKLSLIIQPLAAACGLRVPSLTGRGLGLTGGTADKLESIPGYNASLSLAEFRNTVNSCGVSMTVQTEEIAPADKKLYALRDVTGTVASIPLIVASILSKKLAEGADTLVFDVKCGKGAFMKTPEDAHALAAALVNGAKNAGRKAAALVTSMDEPLGFAVGNALEVDEALDVLEGRSNPPYVADLSVELAANMVSLAKGLTLDDARNECRNRLADGSAAKRFAAMVELQGGNLAAFRARPPAKHIDIVSSENSGIVGAVDSAAVARAAFILGAGRTKTTDPLDMSAGVILDIKRGDRIKKGDVLARLHTTDRPDVLEDAKKEILAAVELTENPPADYPIISTTVG